MDEYEAWKKRHKFIDDEKIVNRYWDSILIHAYEVSYYFEISSRFTGFWEKGGRKVITLRVYESELFSELYDTTKLKLEEDK